MKVIARASVDINPLQLPWIIVLFFDSFNLNRTSLFIEYAISNEFLFPFVDDLLLASLNYPSTFHNQFQSN
jgi:hypothetical protein